MNGDINMPNNVEQRGNTTTKPPVSPQTTKTSNTKKK